MSFLIDAQEPRSIKAITIAAGASQWMRCQTPAGPRYGIRSSRDPNHYYLTSATECSCEDARRHSAPCKHSRAVQLYEELTRAQQHPEPKPPTPSRPVLLRAELLTADGEMSWERRRSPAQPVSAELTAARARRYSEIFDTFDGD